ncbi:secretion-regulating guanine nucleotide exchange factor-like isoform X2 [Lineus longissimus]|uniref:secretion-regulating guanine nucleotide exchange factor-like isoform X2 n=1 Tax=Lineus longissimus TaxID=88925 RepID=UPI00315C9492
MDLYSWGANSYGQLSANHKDDISYPCKVNIPTRCLPVKQIYGGGGHTIFLSASGEIWSCGWNSKGQLGLGHKDDIQELQLVPSLKSKSVKAVACGWDFSLVLTDDKTLYICGSNAFGQLGVPLEKSSILSLEPSLSMKNVVDIAAGLRHSIILTANGDVMTFGNGKKGQLGQLCSKPVAKQPLPEKVTFPADHARITQVVAGAYHSAALTESGEVLFWGCNKYGQGTQSAGDPIQYNTSLMIRSGTFDGKKVVKLFSGWTHLLALTEDGLVYSWGRADYGQLGRLVTDPCDPKPRPIPGLKVTQLCCGSEHNLATLVLILCCRVWQCCILGLERARHLRYGK